MIHITDLHRELSKLEEVWAQVDRHLGRKDEMNAALHMSGEVRPTPLAAAVNLSHYNLKQLLERLHEGVDNTPS